MASAWKDGELQFIRRKPDGTRILITSKSVAEMNAALGSSDGAIASTASVDKWTYIPPIGGDKELQIGDIFEVFYSAAVAVTIDASDGVCSLSFVLPNSGGSNITFSGNLASTNIWDNVVGTDIAYVAGIPTLLCSMKVKQRMALGGKQFLSVENNG